MKNQNYLQSISFVNQNINEIDLNQHQYHKTYEFNDFINAINQNINVMRLNQNINEIRLNQH